VKISSDVSEIERRRDERDLIEKCEEQTKIQYLKISEIKNNIFEIKQVAAQIILEFIENIDIYYNVPVNNEQDYARIVREFVDENGKIKFLGRGKNVILLSSKLVKLIFNMVDNINLAIAYSKNDVIEIKDFEKQFNIVGNTVATELGLFSNSVNDDSSWLLLASAIKNSVNVIQVIRGIDLLISSNLFIRSAFIKQCDLDPNHFETTEDLVWNPIVSQQIGYKLFVEKKEEWIGNVVWAVLRARGYSDLSHTEKNKVKDDMYKEQLAANSYLNSPEYFEQDDSDECGPDIIEKQFLGVYKLYNTNEDIDKYNYIEIVNAGQVLLKRINDTLPEARDIYCSLLKLHSIKDKSSPNDPKSRNDPKPTKKDELIILRPQFYAHVYN
jgi:hypothetical protein